MIYGVKILRTIGVGEPARYCYEELILRVKADSFEEAYRKAANYARGYGEPYRNPMGETVRTIRIEAVDCFLAFAPEGDVEEVYSATTANHGNISEEAYQNALTSYCDQRELYSLRNAEYNEEDE